LYFIVRVEVVEIQIWFVIYKIDLKKKRISYLKMAFGPIPRCGPAGLTASAANAAQPAGTVAQWIHGCALRSESKHDPITPDPNR
jgi:hypothetical protein